jgi:hypothetical protein
MKKIITQLQGTLLTLVLRIPPCASSSNSSDIKETLASGQNERLHHGLDEPIPEASDRSSNLEYFAPIFSAQNRHLLTEECNEH